LLSTACEFRRRLVYKRKACRQMRLERLVKPFCLTWESSPDVKTALENWKSITGKVVGRLPFQKLASLYRKMGLSLKLMN
jgi:nitrate reductase assembly molybdenum cofactor insertion protein NarJ